MMPQDPRRSRRTNSLQMAAERIRRILEREEQERGTTQRVPAAEPISDGDASLLKAKFPIGSTGWGAQRIRRILDREERPAPAADPSSPEASKSEQYDDYGYGDLAWDIARSIWRNGPSLDPQEVVEQAKAEYEHHVGARAALSEMVGSQLPGRERGPADAYRHILLATELTRRFGEQRARELLDLHEREGNLRGQTADEYEMDLNNNEIGIQIGAFARDYDDVISATRKVISGSAPDGSGSWKPDYDPTTTLAPQAARWLPEWRWANNPDFDQPNDDTEMPTEQTNWYSNPNRPSGPDWTAGYVPDAYRYLYGDPQHATGPEDPMARRAASAYRFSLEDPLLKWLGKIRNGR